MLQSLEEMANMYLTVHFSEVCLNYILSLPDESLEKATGEPFDFLFNTMTHSWNIVESDLAVVLLLCDRVLDQPVTFDFAVNTVIKVCTRLSSWPSAQSEPLAEEISRAKQHLEKKEPVPKVPREQCPACSDRLSTVDNRLLICNSGHTWGNLLTISLSFVYWLLLFYRILQYYRQSVGYPRHTTLRTLWRQEHEINGQYTRRHYPIAVYEVCYMRIELFN